MVDIAMYFTPSAKKYFNLKNAQYLMKEMIFSETVFS